MDLFDQDTMHIVLKPLALETPEPQQCSIPSTLRKTPRLEVRSNTANEKRILK